MIDPDTLERIPLAPIVLPDVEGHDMSIAPLPKGEGKIVWTEYIAVCECGWMAQARGNRYLTERGAKEYAKRHLDSVAADTATDAKTNPLKALGII